MKRRREEHQTLDVVQMQMGQEDVDRPFRAAQRQAEVADPRSRIEDQLAAPRERLDCRRALEDEGYETLEEGFDTWCLVTSPEDRLTRSWKGLRPGAPALSVHEETA